MWDSQCEITVRLDRTTKTMTMTYIWIIHLYSTVINITRFRDRINISDANSEHWQLVLLWDLKNGKKEKSFHDFQGWPCTCTADWSVSCSFVSLLYNKKYLWLTLTQTFSQSCPLVLATLCQLNIDSFNSQCQIFSKNYYCVCEISHSLSRPSPVVL